MEQWDPPQAMMTRQAIAPAGSPDVCSTCGDDPANDYYLPASYRSAGDRESAQVVSRPVSQRRVFEKNSAKSLILDSITRFRSSPPHSAF